MYSFLKFLVLTLMMSMSGDGGAGEGEGEEQRVVTVRGELTSRPVKLLRLSSTASARSWSVHWSLEHWFTPRLGMGKSGQSDWLELAGPRLQAGAARTGVWLLPDQSGLVTALSPRPHALNVTKLENVYN